MCIRCDERLTIEHILLTSDFNEIRERRFTAQPQRVLVQEILDEVFNLLKNINIFDRI